MSKWNVLFSSKIDEYLTPKWLFKLIEKYYGKFDLDPACDPNNHLEIPICYTKKENGLLRPWKGNVFINPPYSKINEYINKALLELSRGEVKQVVFLVPARTDTKWFHKAISSKYFSEIVFIKGRITFENTNNSAPFPSILLVLKKENMKPRIGILDQKYRVITYLQQ